MDQEQKRIKILSKYLDSEEKPKKKKQITSVHDNFLVRDDDEIVQQ